MSVFIIRAFVKQREEIASNQVILRRLLPFIWRVQPAGYNIRPGSKAWVNIRPDTLLSDKIKFFDFCSQFFNYHRSKFKNHGAEIKKAGDDL